MAYRAALDLYAGDLLPEDLYEAWAQDRRESLRQLYLALLLGLAKLQEESNDHGPAIESLRKATAEEPTLEAAHAGLIRLHALSGGPDQAIAQYDRFRDTLARTLGTEPAEATRRLRDEIATGVFSLSTTDEIQERRGPDSSDTHNLPARRTSFVGREREMAEVKRLLSMTRLLTVTGAGGSGKTRLALEVARDLAGAYPDGVWLLELAGISEYELVPQAVAAALGVTERPGETLSQTLVDVLGARQTLLVLDNCEHLVEAVASLVDTLLDLGSAVELRGAVGLQHTPAEDAMREPYLEGARSRLDGATWEALWTSSERVNPTMGRESVVSVGRRAPGSATTTKRATE